MAYGATNEASLYFEHSGEKIRFKIISATADMSISCEDGHSFVKTETIKISGKSRSRYQRHHVFDLPKPGSRWSVRLRRITPDATDGYTSNETYFDTLVSITGSRMNYANSALIGLSVNAEQFNSMPSRAYLVKGLYIRVPSNYDPETRTYTGVWDGDLKPAVSDNPAWVLYDILTNERYGLGQFIKKEQVDKARLYQIGRYCDELVPDGFGGMEPRFTINTQIQTQAEAYRLISDVCSVFRGMSFWNGSLASFTCDMPTDESAIFTPANVVGGEFQYAGSSRKDRHSVVLVRWNDPDENYKQKIEYVEDSELVAQFGVRKTETSAFGCTSRGQANRIGRWMIFTERYESNVISFKVGLDSAFLLPGEIIQIHDPFRAGKRMGGRIAASTDTSVTLDAPITLTASGGKLSMRLPDGTFVNRMINEGAGTFETLTWTEPLTVLPLPNAMWLVAEPNLQPLLARVVGVSQTDKPNEFGIAAIEHNPSKYAAIEQGLKLETIPTSIIDANAPVPQPVDLSAYESLYSPAPGVIASRLHVSWSGTTPSYELSYRKVGAKVSNWTTVTTSSSELEIDNCEIATYEFELYAINALGRRSQPVRLTKSVTQDAIKPGDPTGLSVDGTGGTQWSGRDLRVSWRPASMVGSVEFGSESAADAGSVDLALKDYQVKVFDKDGVLLRTEYVTQTQYLYDYERNVADGGPRRALIVQVAQRSINGTVSDRPQRGLFVNPQATIATNQVKYVAGFESIKIALPLDTTPDFGGYLVWLRKGTTPPSTIGGYTQAQREAAAVFDATRYLTMHPEVATSGKTAQEYYHSVGWKLGHNPNAFFDTNWYIANNKDVADAKVDPFQHYQTIGLAQGRLPNAISTVNIGSDDLVYDGPQTLITLNKLDSNSDYTLVVGTYDVFSKTDAVITSPISFKTPFMDIGAIQDGIIGESKLREDLATRIDLIDAPVEVIGSVAQRLDELRTEIDLTKVSSAYAESTFSTKVDTDAAIATAKTQAIAASNANLAAALSSYYTKTTVDSAIAQAKTEAIAASGTNTANSLSSYYTKTQTDSAIATAKTEAISISNTNLANSLSDYYTKTTVDSAIATAKTQAISSANSNTAASLASYYTKAQTDSAIATQVSTVQARLDTGDYAAVKASATASANKLGVMDAQYVLKLDVNGNTAGFGVATSSSVVNGKVSWTSEFAVRADKFYITMPGYGDATPFVIGAVGGTPRVVMSNALIGDATITMAKIEQIIRSSNYVAGSSGWALNQNGNLELNNATVRGTIYATAGSMTNVTVSGTLSAGKIQIGADGASGMTLVDFNSPGWWVPFPAVARAQQQVGYVNSGSVTEATSCRFFGVAIGGTPFGRRVRTGNVTFIAQMHAVVDHYLSLFYKVNGGSWIPFATAVEPQAGYGSIAVSGMIDLNVSATDTIYFGFGPIDSSFNCLSSGSLEVRTAGIIVQAYNI